MSEERLSIAELWAGLKGPVPSRHCLDLAGLFQRRGQWEEGSQAGKPVAFF
jgi:hypothetical protein